MHHVIIGLCTLDARVTILFPFYFYIYELKYCFPPCDATKYSQLISCHG